MISGVFVIASVVIEVKGFSSLNGFGCVKEKSYSALVTEPHTLHIFKLRWAMMSFVVIIDSEEKPWDVSIKLRDDVKALYGPWWSYQKENTVILLEIQSHPFVFYLSNILRDYSQWLNKLGGN